MKVDVEERVERGKEWFKKGFNCSQAVVMAFADVYGLERDMALRMSSSFGGGLGRMRLTCGAVSGMCMLAGLETGSVVEGDNEGKARNYALVQQLAHRFEKEAGSIVCSELLGLKPMTPITTTPEERTPEYYKKRPCVETVALACRIYAEHLNDTVPGI